MRKIQRVQPSPEIAESLASAKSRGLPWSDFDSGLVRGGLRKMQHGFCAYCEDKLNSNDSNTRIDHFVPRSSAAGKSLVYEWTNLLLSCDCCETCDSRKKDSTAAIVNPGVDVPKDYLAYLPNGMVVPVSGENGPKGKVTVRVLNLNGGLLPIRRVSEWNRYLKYCQKYSLGLQVLDAAHFLCRPFGSFFVYMASRRS